MKISFVENKSENRVSNFCNVMGNIWEKVSFWGSLIFQIIACAIYTPIFALIGCLQLLLLDNPLMFTIWAHIFPKRMAEHLYEIPEEKGHNLIALWFSICFNFFLCLERLMCCWTPEYFAWYAKKVFIAEEPTAFNADDVVRYLRTLTNDEKVSFFENLLSKNYDCKEMNDKKKALMNEMWAMNDMWLRMPYLKAKGKRNEKFTTDEMQSICNYQMFDLLDAYMKYSTLSEDMLKIMVSCDDGEIQKRVYNHIIKHGVSAEFVAWANMQGEGASKLVDDCLTIYSQLVMTKELQCTTDEKVAESWKQYLEVTPNICREAQLEFCLRQLVIFYVQGRELCEEAVFHFFYLATKEKNEMAKAIFRHEGAKALKSDRIRTLVKTNYWLNCHALGLA